MSLRLDKKAVDKAVRILIEGSLVLEVAVESGDGALASLTSRLAERERDLAIVRSRRREVEEQAGRKGKLASPRRCFSERSW